MAQPEEIYLDHDASAPLLPEARAAILRALDIGPGNPSSSHAAGRRLRRVLGDARQDVADLVGANSSEIVFTSGTSESNALGIRGLLGALPREKRRIVLTEAAHPGTLTLAEALREDGVDIAVVGVDAQGVVSVADLASATGEQPCVLSISAAQSVTGALQPVAAIGRALPEASLHCDAAQLVGRVPVEFHALGAATLAFSAHKMGGPRGIGALVIRDGAAFKAPDGEAAQERGRRAGTEAVALAAGFAAAATVARSWPVAHGAAWRALLQPLRAFVGEFGGGEVVTPDHALPNTLLVRFAGCPGDAVLAALDGVGIRVSTGTACASGARTPPRVLTTAGHSDVEASECIRVSVGVGSTERDVARLLGALRDALPRIRAALSSTSAGEPTGAPKPDTER